MNEVEAAKQNQARIREWVEMRPDWTPTCNTGLCPKCETVCWYKNPDRQTFQDYMAEQGRCPECGSDHCIYHSWNNRRDGIAAPKG